MIQNEVEEAHVYFFNLFFTNLKFTGLKKVVSDEFYCDKDVQFFEIMNDF